MGLNQIATLNVPTSNGEGTASDLNTMAANKTIELSGTYVGRFVILGSHDGTAYAPLAIFDSGAGAQAFKQVINVTTRYLKVLRKTASGGTVVISVAAETTALNNYITLATLTVGATGPQPSSDLWTLVPGTGLEGEISFFGRGSVSGSVVIEGSMDNSNWNPLGEFDSGLLASGDAMSFSPIVAGEIVRYVRINVQGVVGRDGFKITLGAIQNLSPISRYLIPGTTAGYTTFLSAAANKITGVAIPSWAQWIEVEYFLKIGAGFPWYMYMLPDDLTTNMSSASLTALAGTATQVLSLPLGFTQDANRDVIEGWFRFDVDTLNTAKNFISHTFAQTVAGAVVDPYDFRGVLNRSARVSTFGIIGAIAAGEVANALAAGSWLKVYACGSPQ